MSHSNISQRLRGALFRKDLVIFCGAGVSMLAPSLLPSWWQVYEAFLDESKHLALIHLRHNTDACNAVKSISLNDFSLVSFSEILVRIFAGEFYFSVLEVLDTEIANANHFAIAELVRAGVLKAVITTNFDTLIERAFSEAGIPLHTISPPGAQEVPSNNACLLYKIHGSVTETSSLVDTISQKLRPLPEPMKSQVEHLIRTHHVLVIGYSGADLSLGHSPLLTRPEPPLTGMTWLVREDGLAKDVVNILKQRDIEPEIVKGSLPEFFSALGVVPHGSPPPRMQGECPQKRVRARVAKFFAEPFAGPYAAICFCGQALEMLGHPLAAQHIWDALEDDPILKGNSVPISGFIALRTLGLAAIKERRFHTAKFWFERELIGHNKLRQASVDRADAECLSAKIDAEWRTNRAAALINLSVACMALGDYAAARTALDEALALTSENAGLSGLVRINFAKLAICEDNLDLALLHLHDALLLGSKAGRPDVLRAALQIRAEVFTWRTEYDRAVGDLTTIEGLFRTAGLDPLGWAQEMQLRAEIAVLQGQPESVYDFFTASFAMHPTLRQSPVVADLHVSLIRLCALSETLRGQLLNDARQLLAMTTDIRRRDQLLTLLRQLEDAGRV